MWDWGCERGNLKLPNQMRSTTLALHKHEEDSLRQHPMAFVLYDSAKFSEGLTVSCSISHNILNWYPFLQKIQRAELLFCPRKLLSWFFELIAEFAPSDYLFIKLKEHLGGKTLLRWQKSKCRTVKRGSGRLLWNKNKKNSFHDW